MTSFFVNKNVWNLSAIWFLRHEQQQQQNHDKKSDSDPCFEGGQEIGNYSLEHELDNSHLEHNEPCFGVVETVRSEEHTSELQSLV